MIEETRATQRSGARRGRAAGDVERRREGHRLQEDQVPHARERRLRRRAPARDADAHDELLAHRAGEALRRLDGGPARRGAPRRSTGCAASASALETVAALALMCDPRDLGQTIGDGGEEGDAPPAIAITGGHVPEAGSIRRSSCSTACRAAWASPSASTSARTSCSVARGSSWRTVLARPGARSAWAPASVTCARARSASGRRSGSSRPSSTRRDGAAQSVVRTRKDRKGARDARARGSFSLAPLAPLRSLGSSDFAAARPIA